MIVIIITIVLIAMIVIAVSKQKKTGESPYSYQRVDALFTPAERSFLGILDQVAGERVRIFGKVRVADVITPGKGIPKSDWRKAFNKISCKHFDFVLCDSKDLSVQCVIELNDNSHSLKSRKERDVFLAEACSSAGLPLIQIPAKSAYSVKEINNLLVQHIALQTVINNKNSDQLMSKTGSDTPVCLKCSSQLVRRVAKKGAHAGNEFWACSAYPKCRYIEAVTENSHSIR